MLSTQDFFYPYLHRHPLMDHGFVLASWMRELRDSRSTLSMRQGLSGVDRLRVPSFMRFMMKQRPHAVTHHVGMVTSLTRYNVATTSHVRGHW